MQIILKAPANDPNFWSGYTVKPYAPVYDETSADTDSSSDIQMMPYVVNGPRKEWGLMRSQPHPQQLFPVPKEITKGQLAIKGVKWFKEVIEGDTVTLIPLI